MKFLFLIPLLLITAASAEPGTDQLRFKNGDALRGQYISIEEDNLILWQSNEADEPIPFKTKNLQKLSLNQGRSRQPITSRGLITLTNNDVIPGEIVEIDSHTVTVDTEYAGILEISRESVRNIHPNRLGGGILYAGPFSEEHWQVLKPQVIIEEEPLANPAPIPADEAEEISEEPEEPQGWVYGGSAWYNQTSAPLCLQIPLPDRASIRFHIAWQNKLNVNFALMADFTAPLKQEGDEDEKKKKERVTRDILETGTGRSVEQKYGSGYLLSLQSTYAKLQRINANNPKDKKTFRTNNSNAILRDLYEADFEIRLDRLEGTISLLINGEFYAEWEDHERTLSEVPRYFALGTQAKSLVRVSDVAIAEWNGMPDSARSMQSDDRDIILLTNGTDRFSGELLSLEEGVFKIKSDYATFQVPLADTSDIQLATGTRASAEKPHQDSIFVNLQPHGQLTLTPKKGNEGKLNGTHSILGDLELDLDFSYLIEFHPESTIFDNWDHDF